MASQTQTPKPKLEKETQVIVFESKEFTYRGKDYNDVLKEVYNYVNGKLVATKYLRCTITKCEEIPRSKFMELIADYHLTDSVRTQHIMYDFKEV